MADPTTFVALIRDLRSRLDLSQQKLADRLHVSFPTIHRWENGKSAPDEALRHLLRQFIAKLGPKYSDLLATLEANADAGGDGLAPSRRGRRKKAPETDADAPAGLDIRGMEGLLWRAACSIRGEKDAPKFKDYILPLIFIKRLSDVFDDEIARLSQEFGSEKTARSLVESDRSLVRFYLPPEGRWPVVSGRTEHDWPAGKRPKTRGELITIALRAIVRENPKLQGVIDTADFNETRNGEREVSDDALTRLTETLSDPRCRLGLADVEPDFLGRAYEYLLRKFAEPGQTAGEFFTPKEVGWLIAHLVKPCPGERAYDPCCGSAGLLIKCQLALRQREPNSQRPLKLYGQELTGSSYAIARMNMVIHDMEGEVMRGNTMSNPKFLSGGALDRFDIVVTNPMWNDPNTTPGLYETDPFDRFSPRGGPTVASKADWAWMQHVAASLAPSGRAAVVIDTGAASRGSGSQGEDREKVIRRWFVERDLIEGVVLLPDNLFYNTTAAGLVILLNAAKPAVRRGQIILVNAAAEFRKGRPKNELTDEGTEKIIACFREWKERGGLAKIADQAALAAADFNLSPSRFVDPIATEKTADIQTLLDDLARLDREATALDGELAATFQSLGYRWGGPV